MTICIAAMCENGKAVIAASDKMITYSAPPYHQFEHPRSKLQILARRAVIATAGSALLPSEFINLIKEEMAKIEKLNIREIAYAAERAYRRLRVKGIEGRVLSAYGITWSEYRDIVKSGEITDLYYRIISQVENFRIELEAIIAGVDESGAHIYVIDNPGYSNSFDDIGYTAIGSGEYHAIRSFIENYYSVSLPIPQALYVVYEAKKYAEFAPGVGKQTDIVIITEDGVIEVNEKIKNELDEAYKTKMKIIEELREKSLKDYFEKIDKYLKSY